MISRQGFLLVAVVLWGACGCKDGGGGIDLGDPGLDADAAIPDVVPDAGPDAVPDVVPDAIPDGVPDGIPDAIPEADVGVDVDTGTDAEADVPVPDTVADTLGDTDTGPVAECDKPANTAHRQALLDGQPVLGVRSRAVLTQAITFASLAGNPAVTCSVDLQFKDSNGNGTLEPYENWTLTPALRAADLVPRMTEAQKLGLMAHPTTSDAPTSSNAAISAELTGLVDKHVRFGVTTALRAQLGARATWANNVQERCEASAHGIPFVISSAPAHSDGGGRAKAAGFSKWPHEFGLAATGSPAIVQTFAEVVSQEYRAIGVRMALSPNADLATEPRWYLSQFTFGEDSASATARVAAYIRGLQGETLGAAGVAATVMSFPGAGPSKDGWDTRLAKGKYLSYPGNRIDDHLAPFAGAFDAGVAAVMLSYGVPETGTWTGLGTVLDGSTIQQVGTSFNTPLVSGALRGHYGYDGLVIAPPGVLDDAGAPWGVEASSRPERIGLAVNAGVDQFAGLNDVTPLADAKAAGLIGNDRLDASARRALALPFALGLFENPYVDPLKAPALVNTDTSYRAGLNAMNQSMVLLVNQAKPVGWLNGAGDGTQTGDKGNAGNGSGKVLPAPPGEPYVAAGCSYFVMGAFDLDYIRSVSTGYGEMTNDATSIDGVTVGTPAERIPLTDYVFVRIPAPYTADPDSGDLAYGLQSLEYATNDNAAVLDDLAFARTAIDAKAGSKTQIIVGIDAGRTSVVDEVLGYGVSGLYIEWSVTDKVFLDVAFGIVNGRGTLPAGLPASNAAAETQSEDVAGDGQHGTFVEGFGLQTNSF